MGRVAWATSAALNRAGLPDMRNRALEGVDPPGEALLGRNRAVRRPQYARTHHHGPQAGLPAQGFRSVAFPPALQTVATEPTGGPAMPNPPITAARPRGNLTPLPFSPRPPGKAAGAPVDYRKPYTESWRRMQALPRSTLEALDEGRRALTEIGPPAPDQRASTREVYAAEGGSRNWSLCSRA